MRRSVQSASRSTETPSESLVSRKSPPDSREIASNGYRNVAKVQSEVGAELDGRARPLPSDFVGEIARIMCEEAALVVLDEDATVLWGNDAGLSLLKSFGLMVSGSERIAMPDADTRDRLEALLHTGSDTDRMFVTINPPSEWVVLHCHPSKMDGKPVRLVRLSHSSPRIDCESSGFAAQFALTPAECTVANLFARLNSVALIAKELKIGSATVRSHLKNVYSKTGVHSGRELIRLIAAFEAI